MVEVTFFLGEKDPLIDEWKTGIRYRHPLTIADIGYLSLLLWC
jgi:hypothetical protein